MHSRLNANSKGEFDGIPMATIAPKVRGIKLPTHDPGNRGNSKRRYKRKVNKEAEMDALSTSVHSNSNVSGAGTIVPMSVTASATAVSIVTAAIATNAASSTAATATSTAIAIAVAGTAGTFAVVGAVTCAYYLIKRFRARNLL